MNNNKIETVNVAILINNIEEIVIFQIIEIAKAVKSLKIVTNDANKFLYIEEKLYIEYGIAIQVTNNKEKGIANAHIIINFDFDEKKINEYVLPSLSTIINIKQKISINSIKFNGNIINNYKIKYNELIAEQFLEKTDFDSNVLYESLIYRRDTFTNIKKQLDKDEVKIIELM